MTVYPDAINTQELQRDYDRTLAWINGIRAAFGHDALDALPDDTVSTEDAPRTKTCPVARALGCFEQPAASGYAVDFWPSVDSMRALESPRIIRCPDYVRAVIHNFDFDLARKAKAAE